MKRNKIIICCLALIAVLLVTGLAAAEGSLESYGKGLWHYYGGHSKTWVKKNAPQFEKLDTNRYQLDYQELNGLDFYLLGDFSGTKLTLLQIWMPVEEHKSCNKDIKQIAETFALISGEFMGLTFDRKTECTVKEGSVICMNDTYLCIYEQCPEDMATYACTELQYLQK